MKLLILSILLPMLLLTVDAQHAVITCTWPCPNPSHVCEITPEGGQCKPRLGNQWIMTRPGRLPVYAGPRVHRPGQECVPTPIPDFPPVENTSVPISSSETIIRWPPHRENYPLDVFVGNCDENLFCGPDHMSHERLAAGRSCDSSNQCATGPCLNGICQQEQREEQDQTLANGAVGSSFAHYESQASTVVHVIAAVFGILGGLLVVVGIFVMFRRRRARQVPVDAEQRPTTDANRFNKFANDFCRDEDRPNGPQTPSNEPLPQASPMMQQIHLQFQLLQQQQQMSKLSNDRQIPSTSSSPAPPPYQP
ncbi:hypothetical protein EC973_001465 [Apophysomyces ossiformis]|uniref:Uncharacterized protein n=1 Tax=Apophysomyces ossiformis TaxID=679940 RepID=A0A8H7BQ81_9FUNG|nr:hypothetical protein EC973_001465 [Apophysomyces ossiformis]